jgi:hypothetical protein
MFRNNWQRTVCELVRSRREPSDCSGCPYLIDRTRGLCQANAHYVPGHGWIRDDEHCKEGTVIGN